MSIPENFPVLSNPAPSSLRGRDLDEIERLYLRDGEKGAFKRALERAHRLGIEEASDAVRDVMDHETPNTEVYLGELRALKAINHLIPDPPTVKAEVECLRCLFGLEHEGYPCDGKPRVHPGPPSSHSLNCQDGYCECRAPSAAAGPARER